MGTRMAGTPVRLVARMGLAALLSLVLLVTLLDRVPAAAQESSGEACGSSELSAADELSASVLARECGQVVEVASGRGFTQRLFAEPDGTFTLRTYARPQWAVDDRGQWVPVDATFVARADGRVATAATVVDIEVSPGGHGAFATVTDRVGRSLSLTWPGELAKPVLDGATATYPDVFDGVDLQVTAGVDWFSYALVVHTRQAAQRAPLSEVEVGVQVDGLELAESPDGAVVARDGGGQAVFSGGRAFMWDSSSAPPAPGLAGVAGGDVPGLEPGRLVEMDVQLSGDTLRVTPDQAMLTDASTQFPVTIDPTFTAQRLAWTVVGDEAYVDDTFWDDSTWPRNEGLRMGYQGWTAPGSEGYGTWRSMARFDTEVLRGATVHSVQVDLTVWHSGGCWGPFPLELWQTAPIEHGQVPTSWNSTGGHWSSRLQTRMVDSANSTAEEWCGPFPDQDVTWGNTSVRNAVQDNARAERSSITFGLRTSDESDRNQWMRAYADSFALEVNYTPVTAVPNQLTTDGVGCLAPGGSRVSGTSPTLAGVPRHSEGLVQARFEVRTAEGSDNLHTWLSDESDTGTQVAWQVDAPLADGDYRWRMRSEDPNSSTTSAWSGWCEFSVDALLDTEPDPFSGVMECPADDGQVLQSVHESVALLLAQACDEPAEVISLRDYGTRVLAQPDGNLLAEQYTVPQWAHDDDGEWAEVDTALVTDGEGRISTAAAVSDIEVSAGGQGPLVTATDPDGGSISLWWPDPLPSPVVHGDTVTYPEVLSDVDLQVTAGVDGFSYVLVVKSADAAADPALASVTVGISADGGLSLQQDGDGAVEAVNAAGDVVFSSPAAFMWDSSQPADEGEPQLLGEGEGSGDDHPMPGKYAEMPLQLDGSSLTVVPDQDMLTDPDAVFPIKIDPPFVGDRMHWATVHQGQAHRGWTDDSAWPRRGQGGPEMRIGRLGYWPGDPCGDACGLWRSAVRFDVGELSGRQIVSAAVKATQTHTSGCDSYGLELWWVTAFTNGVSWNGLSGNWQNRLQTRTLASSNRAGGCSGTSPTGVTYNNSAVRNRVQSHADAGHGSLSFGFRSSDESSILPYRRIAVGSVVLEVVYNLPAQTPTGLSTNRQGCASSGPGPWLNDPRPTLYGTPRDPDGRVGAHIQIRRIGSSSTFYSWQTGRNLQHNKEVKHRIPAGDRLPSGAYRWRMRSLDNMAAAGASSWNQWCYFRVDATSPSTPAIEIVGDPPQAGEPVTLRLSSSDAHSGVRKFSYGINEEVQRHEEFSSGTTEITFTAEESGGRNWVYVWAHDHAGNTSNRAVYDFFAARFVEATPAGAWRLDGDAVDDSGHGHELTFGSGAAWSNDAAFGGQSLEFDGTGCVGTEGPVVRIDAEYTIAAWVRLDDNSARRAVMGAAGQDRLGFYLRYRVENDRWQFLIGDRDARSVSWASLYSTQSPTVGEWTHLAVRVDPAARHMQLYINGQLDNEREIPWATWNTEGPLRVGCSSRIAGNTWDHYVGAIHHVGVWQGLLTPQQIQAAYDGDLPAGLTGDWRLRANGVDVSAHARDLNVPAQASWIDDQYGRQDSAMQLDGTAWAESNEPIVRTDQSFTVSAWARLDDNTGFRTVVAQAAPDRASFGLNYNSTLDRWVFTMRSENIPSGYTWHGVSSTSAPEIGAWYHLVGIFDLSTGRVSLFVDGELQKTASGPEQPWHADGEFLIGSAGAAGGDRYYPMVGAVSDVRAWRGALTGEQVAEVHGGNPAVRWVSQWNLNGSGADQRGGNGLTPSGVLFVDYEWTLNRWCFPFSAFGLPAAGSGYAATSAAVVDTDESLTVTAWVRLDSLDGYQTVLSQGGAAQAAMLLQATPDGRWRFAMPQQDAGSPDVVAAESDPGVVQVGQWTHLAGIFDLARGQVRLYVGGELVDVSDGVVSPWHGDGPLYVGVTGLADGTTSQRMHGVVDEVTAWSSTLDPDRIRDFAKADPGFPCFF
jgi:hypothetical protein